MTLYLTDTEARAFAQGERVLWRWFKQQPRIDNRGIVYDTDGCGSVDFMRREPWHFDKRIPKPGTPIDLKETWAWDDLYDKYIWKADLSLPFAESQMPPIIHWRSPVTMPAAAVRWHMTVTNVEAVEKDGWWWKITMEERRGND